MWIVTCENGEPDADLWRYYGPFNGKEHAELWVAAVHCNQAYKGKCNQGYQAYEHRASSVEKAVVAYLGCGCVAGTHDNTLVAMEEYHPDVKTPASVLQRQRG